MTIIPKKAALWHGLITAGIVVLVLIVLHVFPQLQFWNKIRPRTGAPASGTGASA